MNEDGHRPSEELARRERRADRVTVLYIAGWQRSGSTVLANILGQIDGFVSVGELYYLWDYVWLRNTRCGCRRPFRECPLWSAVVTAAYGGFDGVDAEAMLRLGKHVVRTRRMAHMGVPTLRRRLLGEVAPYVDGLRRLYTAIAAVTGCRVIVDSSKWPSYGLVLEAVPSLDVRLLHLVRDPRAVAHSWTNPKLLPDRTDGRVDYMERRPVDSALRWLVWNAAASWYSAGRRERYSRLSYERFMKVPREAVGDILDLVGEPATTPLPFESDRVVRLAPTHTVSGNPARFRYGAVELRSDDRWRTEMSWKDRAIVGALTKPLDVVYRRSEGGDGRRRGKHRSRRAPPTSGRHG